MKSLAASVPVGAKPGEEGKPGSKPVGHGNPGKALECGSGVKRLRGRDLLPGANKNVVIAAPQEFAVVATVDPELSQNPRYYGLVVQSGRIALVEPRLLEHIADAEQAFDERSGQLAALEVVGRPGVRVQYGQPGQMHNLLREEDRPGLAVGAVHLLDQDRFRLLGPVETLDDQPMRLGTGRRGGVDHAGESPQDIQAVEGRHAGEALDDVGLAQLDLGQRLPGEEDVSK